MANQVINSRSANDKYHWWIDCGDVDDNIESYAASLKTAQEEADKWASFCPFAYVYIEDADTGEVVDAYWVR